jgi:hypothetical protein
MLECERHLNNRLLTFGEMSGREMKSYAHGTAIPMITEYRAGGRKEKKRKEYEKCGEAVE